MAETRLRSEIVQQYCGGNGVDIGCGGDPVVPWAVQIDLPYGVGDKPPPRPAGLSTHLVIDGTRDLPFVDNCLDFVFSSHLIEDFSDWDPILREWVRVLKPGGHLVIFLPDHVRFRAAVRRGQPDNPYHKHESFSGELSSYAARLFPTMVVIEDRLTNLWPEDYNIVFVGLKSHL